MKTESFRPDRRRFLKALPVIALAPSLALSSPLDTRISNLTPYSQVGYGKKPIKGVVWTKKHLEDRYPIMPADSETLRTSNSDLRQDHNTETIALLQDEEPYDLLGSLEDSEDLCENKPTINLLSEEYKPRTLNLRSSTSFDFFGERESLSRGGIYMPSQDFLREKYEQALASGTEKAFLETYRTYFEELDSLVSDLGFNAIILPENPLNKYIPYRGVEHLSASKRELRNLKV